MFSIKKNQGSCLQDYSFNTDITANRELLYTVVCRSLYCNYAGNRARQVARLANVAYL